jgi:hypothetical protein
VRGSTGRHQTGRSADAWLTEQIREIWEANRKVYGARRVHAALRLGRGITVSRLSARGTQRALVHRHHLPGDWQGRCYLAAVQDLYSRRYARRRPVISTIARRRHTTVLWVSLLAVLVAITVSPIASIRDSDGRPVPTVLAAGAPGQDAMAI